MDYPHSRWRKNHESAYFVHSSLAQVIPANLFNILILHEPSTSLSSRLFALFFSFLAFELIVETKQASLMGLIFHFGYVLPEEYIKQWPSFNCEEL